MSIEDKVADLEKRISLQEDMHKDITMTTNGFLHGAIRTAPFLFLSVILSGMVAYYVVKKVK